jgi:hypothetical protein
VSILRGVSCYPGRADHGIPNTFIIEFQDKYVPDPPAKDAPGGPRIACGVIVKQ